jgi:hypothetical protein
MSEHTLRIATWLHYALYSLVAVSLFLQFTMFNLRFVSDLGVMVVTELLIFVALAIAFFTFRPRY